VKRAPAGTGQRRGEEPTADGTRESGGWVPPVGSQLQSCGAGVAEAASDSTNVRLFCEEKIPSLLLSEKKKEMLSQLSRRSPRIRAFHGELFYVQKIERDGRSAAKLVRYRP
jgi:hypothetical protein